MVLRAIFLLAAGLWLGASPAAAQDPMEAQRCIWRCLSAFGPATAPAYHACVAERCSEGPARESRPPAPQWTGGRTNPANPPYLDGSYATTRSLDGSVRMLYSCGRNGESSLALEGEPLDRVGGVSAAAGLSLVVRFVVDGSTISAKLENYEGSWVMLPSPSLISALRGGNSVTVVHAADGRELARFGLRGSSATIGGALAYCGLS